MVQERKRAADKRYLDPILATKKDTDDQFHKVHSLVHSKKRSLSHAHSFLPTLLFRSFVVVVVGCCRCGLLNV